VRLLSVRQPVILLIAFGLAGCGIAQRQEQQAAAQAWQATIDAANQQHAADNAQCYATFSESDKEAVARAKCLADADRKALPTRSHPDLSTLLTAKRTELAERQAAGKITRAQAVFEFGQLKAQVISEEQQRDNSNRSVAAQQQAATAATIGAINAGAPRSCTRIGNTVNCY
jgi:hypothetical protein